MNIQYVMGIIWKLFWRIFLAVGNKTRFGLRVLPENRESWKEMFYMFYILITCSLWLENRIIKLTRCLTNMKKINLKQPKKPWISPHVSLKLYASFLSIFLRINIKALSLNPLKISLGITQKTFYSLNSDLRFGQILRY